MVNGCRMIGVKSVAERLRITEKHAYKIIRSLNNELEERGYCIVRGRVDEGYFAKRYFPSMQKKTEDDDGGI